MTEGPKKPDTPTYELYESVASLVVKLYNPHSKSTSTNRGIETTLPVMEVSDNQYLLGEEGVNPGPLNEVGDTEDSIRRLPFAEYNLDYLVKEAQAFGAERAQATNQDYVNVIIKSHTPPKYIRGEAAPSKITGAVDLLAEDTPMNLGQGDSDTFPNIPDPLDPNERLFGGSKVPPDRNDTYARLSGLLDNPNEIRPPSEPSRLDYTELLKKLKPENEPPKGTDRGNGSTS
jgi:hypothetical protein